MSFLPGMFNLLNLGLELLRVEGIALGILPTSVQPSSIKYSNLILPF